MFYENMKGDYWDILGHKQSHCYVLLLLGTQSKAKPPLQFFQNNHNLKPDRNFTFYMWTNLLQEHLQPFAKMKYTVKILASRYQTRLNLQILVLKQSKVQSFFAYKVHDFRRDFPGNRLNKNRFR